MIYIIIFLVVWFVLSSSLRDDKKYQPHQHSYIFVRTTSVPTKTIPAHWYHQYYFVPIGVVDPSLTDSKIPPKPGKDYIWAVEKKTPSHEESILVCSSCGNEIRK